MPYIARASARNGRCLYVSAPHEDREAAAHEAWIHCPRARSVSTAIAHEGRETGRDIRWHTNYRQGAYRLPPTYGE